MYFKGLTFIFSEDPPENHLKVIGGLLLKYYVLCIIIIIIGVLLKLWASGQSDAFLLLLLGFTADVHTFCMLSIFC